LYLGTFISRDGYEEAKKPGRQAMMWLLTAYVGGLPGVLIDSSVSASFARLVVSDIYPNTPLPRSLLSHNYGTEWSGLGVDDMVFGDTRTEAQFSALALFRSRQVQAVADCKSYLH